MEHYFEDVPGLGNVAVSRHAQEKMTQEGITEDVFTHVLFKGKQTREMFDVVNRDGKGIRIVILLKPSPWRGAVLVKTVFRLQPVKLAK